MSHQTDLISQNRIFGWIAVGVAALLFVPLVAMQFNSDINWSLSDFIIMAVMLFTTASLFVLVARRVKKQYYLVIALACLLVFIYVWAELAVGIFTTLGD